MTTKAVLTMMMMKYAATLLLLALSAASSFAVKPASQNLSQRHLQEHTFLPYTKKTAVLSPTALMFRGGPIPNSHSLRLAKAIRGGGRLKRGGSVSATSKSTSTEGNENEKEPSQKSLYGQYIDLLETNPLETKSVSAGVVSALGDILAQWVEAILAKTAFAMNWQRLWAFFLCGTVFVGPFLHNWYGRAVFPSGRWAERRLNAGKVLQTLVSLIVDQTVGVAVFFPLYFFAYELCEALVGFRGKNKRSHIHQQFVLHMAGVVVGEPIPMVERDQTLLVNWTMFVQVKSWLVFLQILSLVAETNFHNKTMSTFGFPSRTHAFMFIVLTFVTCTHTHTHTCPTRINVVNDRISP